MQCIHQKVYAACKKNVYCKNLKYYGAVFHLSFLLI